MMIQSILVKPIRAVSSHSTASNYQMYAFVVMSDSRGLAKRGLMEEEPQTFRGRAAKLFYAADIWRRERDSNPRYPFGYSGFQDRLFQPLTHPSATFPLS